MASFLFEERKITMNSTVVDEKRLVELYNNGMKAQDIADELGISRSQVYNYLRKNGVEWRYPSKALPKTNTAMKKSNKTRQMTKKCPVCKAVNNPKEAKFCCMCGSDIRSEADILLERLNKAYKACCDFIPGSINEEVRNTILDATKFIETHKEI